MSHYVSIVRFIHSFFVLNTVSNRCMWGFQPSAVTAAGPRAPGCTAHGSLCTRCITSGRVVLMSCVRLTVSGEAPAVDVTHKEGQRDRRTTQSDGEVMHLHRHTQAGGRTATGPLGCQYYSQIAAIKATEWHQQPAASVQHREQVFVFRHFLIRKVNAFYHSVRAGPYSASELLVLRVIESWF